MKRRSFLTTLLGGAAIALSIAASPLQAQSKGWKPLFNGKDFTGWVVRGGKAPFAVENGEIVGTVIAGTPNTFLCTEKNYGDFVLELEFNCHKDVNSGVQVRSEYNEKEKIVEGLPPLPGNAKPRSKYKSGPNHVSGYQIEIEFGPGRTAGIYDEDRRNGWVYPAVGTEQDKQFRKDGVNPKIVKPGQWQKLRVEASGDTIKTFLDGKLRANAKDTASLSGLIALQVHSAGARDNGKQVRFRNIQIKEGPLTVIAVPTAK
jgi:nicotinamidase-related amidase